MTASLLSTVRVMESVTILPAMPGDLAAILELMEAVNLPRAGIAEALEYFWITRDRDTIIGTVGLEVYGEFALLRSLAVAPQRQGGGLGKALLETALTAVRCRQFQRVYLLTTTAAPFFTPYGFVPVSRHEVPHSVQHSPEFQGLCPATATCMALSLTYAPAAVTPHFLIRPARFADLPAIQTIHNQGIVDRIATLDTEPRTAEETQQWFRQHGPRHPVLVAETGGVMAGWASLNTFKPRPAYQYVADLSVYVERQWRGKGIGTGLLQAIIALGRQLGYHKIVLSAFTFNTPAMRLYEQQGFTTVGIYREMGLVDGRWVDTIIMERMLTDLP